MGSKSEPKWSASDLFDTSVAVPPTLVPGTKGRRLSYAFVAWTGAAASSIRFGESGDWHPQVAANTSKTFNFPNGFTGGIYFRTDTPQPNSFVRFQVSSNRLPKGGSFTYRKGRHMSSPTLRYGVRQVDTSVAIATPTLVPGTLGLNMTYLRVDPTPTAVQANTNGMFYRLGVNGDRIPLAIAKRYRFPEGFDGGVYVEVATGLATSFAVFTWASDDDITEII